MSFASARECSYRTTQLGATGAVGTALVRVGAVDWYIVVRLPLEIWGVHGPTGIHAHARSYSHNHVHLRWGQLALLIASSFTCIIILHLQ